MPEDEIEPNKTVFMYAIQEGADVDEAKRIAQAVARAKSRTVMGKTIKLIKSQWLIFVGLLLAAISAGTITLIQSISIGVK